MGIDISFGVVGLNNTVFNGSLNKTANSSTPSNIFNSSNQIFQVRVKDIILDKSNPELFQKFGEWNSIGVVFWESLDQTINNDIDINENQYAFPLFPNIKNYPLKNEIIYIIKFANTNISNDLSQTVNYYFPPINVWNSQLHNALPGYDSDPSNDLSQQVDYISSFQGEVRRVKDNSTEIKLGNYFTENNASPLLPYEGDIIYEGRSGNSIRFSSTIDGLVKNGWSRNISNLGSPILILRNGQNSSNIEPWVPIVEDINNDLSSIYLTSNQQLQLFPASVNNFSFSKSTPPTNIGQYSENQIILNSGRLVFNAKSDSVLILANKSIQLSCNETLGVDAKQISLSSNEIYLGSPNDPNMQPIVLGDNLNFVLGDIAIFLQTLNIAFKTATDSNGAPIVSLQSIAYEAETLSNDLLNIVNGENLLSKTVKTI